MFALGLAATACLPSSGMAQGASRSSRGSIVPAVRRDTVYSEVQVEKPAQAVEGAQLPEYPTALRQAGIEGSVVAEFVVRADGSVDADSARIVSASHPGFVDPVRSAIPSLRYLPAEIRGRPVSQLVQQTFVFSLNR